eukprot:SAG11_NODE_909_length_6586_cov_11.216433_3_plen_69_part_00
MLSPLFYLRKLRESTVSVMACVQTETSNALRARWQNHHLQTDSLRQTASAPEAPASTPPLCVHDGHLV